MVTLTSEQAESSFAQLLDTAQTETLVMTRDGRPAVFLVPPHEMEELLDARRRNQAVAALEEWSARELEHTLPAAAALTDEEVNALVHELR